MIKHFLSILAVAIFAFLVIFDFACVYAEAKDYLEDEIYEAWVICQPNDYVNIRRRASKKSESIGMFLPGYSVMVSDQEKDGYLFCPDVQLEETSGWISAGYVVYDEPVALDGAIFTVESNGRVAARKWIDGPRRTWLKRGSEVKVYFLSNEWCVTNKGFVQTRFLVRKE